MPKKNSAADQNPLDVKDENGDTALIRAAKSGNVAGCIELVSCGASADIQNRYKGNALSAAVNSRNDEIALFLISSGADVNKKIDNAGQTVLHLAVFRNMMETAKAILDAGGDINAVNKSGQNSLFYADNPDMAALLLDRGIDPEHLDKEGNTALDCAVKGRKESVVAFLRNRLGQEIDISGLAEVPEMDDLEFWSIIEKTRKASKDDPSRQARLLVLELLDMPLEKTVSFYKKFWILYVECDTDKLWSAFYIINGGCSYDDFFIWMSWLIGQGQSIFSKAMANPETLIRPVRRIKSFVNYINNISSSILIDAPAEVYKIKTGGRDDFFSICHKYIITPEREVQTTGFSEKPEDLKALYPLLFDEFYN